MTPDTTRHDTTKRGLGLEMHAAELLLSVATLIPHDNTNIHVSPHLTTPMINNICIVIVQYTCITSPHLTSPHLGDNGISHSP